MLFAFQECLDERQVRALEGYKQSLQEKKCAELQSKFERVWKEQTEKVSQLRYPLRYFSSFL